jgi:uncharacterized caspase-like protein
MLTRPGQAVEDAINLVILDACRNNPFSRGLKSGVGEGLAPGPRLSGGTLVLYATSPGQTASDNPEWAERAVHWKASGGVGSTGDGH